MRPQDRIGDEFYRSGTLEAQVMQSMATGHSIIQPGRRDAEYLEWLARKTIRETENDPYPRRVPFVEHHTRVDGLVEAWRRIPVILWEGGPDMPRDAVGIVYKGQPVKDWLVSIVRNDDEPVYISVHPDRWEEMRDTLQEAGFEVLNGDAEWTHPSQLWQGEREESPAEVG